MEIVPPDMSFEAMMTVAVWLLEGTLVTLMIWPGMRLGSVIILWLASEIGERW